MNMSHLRFEHIKINELPPQWTKRLPAAQTFTVIIIVENQGIKSTLPKPISIEQDNNAQYLQDLRSQGINLERLKESIEEYKAGKAEILDWDEFE